jgi:hypothetical protein
MDDQEGELTTSVIRTKQFEPLLIPFYHKIMLQRHDPDTFECDQPCFIFQQDNAPSHASKWTLRRLKQEGIEVLDHVGNSPDRNAIEGA